ncbi:MAG TPA: YraN family protein [Candidatus Saccharimonadales bacterium]|nr:YraN family protein [Candidatus Saccharimonadales bacterium]
MTNYAHGQQAETKAAAHLQQAGYDILVRNWRTRHCEIDIVAQMGGVVYFFEVKYRLTDDQGTGMDYITPKKLQQMEFAAESWLAENNWHGDCQLAAIELTGPDVRVTSVITDLL